MKSMLGLRVTLALLVAVLLPLGQAHCAWMAPHAASARVAAHHGHHGAGCCSESEPSPAPRAPTGPCCCDGLQLPAVTTPAIASVASPSSVPVPQAVVSMPTASLEAQTAFVRLEPDARSGSPPDPSAAPQSP